MQKFKLEKDYKYGFHDDVDYVFKAPKGLNAEIVKEISHLKGEPQWMTDFRLRGLDIFLKKPLPTWGADLTGLNFDDIIYYAKTTEKQTKDWRELPENIKKTFDRLGIPEAERNFLAGVGAQYESETVYHNIREELSKKGVIFSDLDTGLKEHEDIVKKYIGTVVPISDNKFAALNSSAWSGGSFVYVPKGVKVDLPLQAYFRINAERMGQFERTLIIVEPNSFVHYVEGCVTAGTMISTKNGFTPVEDIKAGNKVLTHRNRYRKVYHVQSRKYKGNLYRITSYGNTAEDLNITEEHPILAVKQENMDGEQISTEWVTPRMLRKGDYLLTPIDGTVIEKDERTFTILKGNGRHGFKEIGLNLKTDKYFFRLIGYYLAEGSTIQEHYLSFTFNIAEKRYIEDVKSLVKTYFGKEAIEYPVYKGGIQLTLCSTLAARFFKQNFGNSAKTKSLPQWVEFESLEKQRELIKGLWRGDGSFSYDLYKEGVQRRFRINAISETLAFQVKRMLLRLGIFGSLNRWKRSGNRHDLFSIVVGGAYLRLFTDLVDFDIGSTPFAIEHGVQEMIMNTKVSYAKIIGNYLLMPIRKIESEYVEDLNVFNFSVEGDESYIANLVSVHNCTAALYESDAHSLHAAVVEIIAKPGSRVRYTTIQNWSNNVYNLVTKRAFAYRDATVEWIDGNIGSRVTMKYPAVWLMEPGAKAEVLSIAFAGKGQHQDTGAKVIHAAPNTSSTITSKSISKNGGRTSYRGLVKVFKGAKNVKCNVRCDALLLDEKSAADTFPYMEINEKQVRIGHEASVGKIGEEQLFYLMSRGLTEAEAMALIVRGFIEPFTKQLPMEYAVEMNRLIELEMEGSVG